MSKQIKFDEVLPLLEKVYAVISADGIVTGLVQGAFHNYVFALSCVNISLCIISGYVAFFFAIKARDRQGFLDIVETLPCAIAGLCSLVKCLRNYSLRGRIAELLTEFRGLWPSEDGEVGAVFGPLNRFIRGYAALTVCVSLSFVAWPIILMIYDVVTDCDVVLRLPFQLYLPYDWRQSTLLYVISFISESHAAAFTASGIVASDCLALMLMANVSLQFLIVSKKFRHFAARDSKECRRGKLRDIIRHHQSIIRLSTELNFFHSPIFLLTIVSNSVLICQLLFVLMIAPIHHCPKILMFLASTLLQTLVLCWYGDRIVTNSVTVSDAVYGSEWLALETGTARDLLCVMRRAQRPVRLSALGFSTVCLGTFTSILSSSWSYFTLVSTMYEF